MPLHLCHHSAGGQKLPDFYMGIDMRSLTDSADCLPRLGKTLRLDSSVQAAIFAARTLLLVYHQRLQSAINYASQEYKAMRDPHRADFPASGTPPKATATKF